MFDECRHFLLDEFILICTFHLFSGMYVGRFGTNHIALAENGMIIHINFYNEVFVFLIMKILLKDYRYIFNLALKFVTKAINIYNMIQRM